MRIFTTIGFIVGLSIFGFQYLFAQSARNLPEPPFPKAMAGKHAADLEFLSDALKKNDLRSFYKNSCYMGKRIEKEKKELNAIGSSSWRNLSSSRGLQAAEEWLVFLIASAPLIKTNGEATAWSDDDSMNDIYVKISSMGYRSIGDGERIKASAKLLGVQPSILKKNSFAYYLAIVQTLKATERLAIKEEMRIRKECVAIETKLEKLRKECGWGAPNVIMTPKISETHPQHLEYRKKEYEIQYDLATARSEALAFLQTAMTIQWIFESIADKAFAEYVVHAYPKNGAKVRETMKAAGYTDPLELAVVLQKSFGRNKDTEYLFTGLVSKKETDAYFAKVRAKEEKEQKEREAWGREVAKRKEAKFREIAQNLTTRRAARAKVRQQMEEAAKDGKPWANAHIRANEFAAEEKEEAEALKFLAEEAASKERIKRNAEENTPKSQGTKP